MPPSPGRDPGWLFFCLQPGSWHALTNYKIKVPLALVLKEIGHVRAWFGSEPTVGVRSWGDGYHTYLLLSESYSSPAKLAGPAFPFD